MKIEFPARRHIRLYDAQCKFGFSVYRATAVEMNSGSPFQELFQRGDFKETSAEISSKFDAE